MCGVFHISNTYQSTRRWKERETLEQWGTGLLLFHLKVLIIY